MALRSLAQVTTPRDGLPAHESTAAQRGHSVQPHLLPAGSSSNAPPVHPAPGSGRKAMDRLAAASTIAANAACRGGQNGSKRHETGVVSRVPSGSRCAKAQGTDRNTDLNGDTPAQPAETGPLHEKPDIERPSLRAAATARSLSGHAQMT